MQKNSPDCHAVYDVHPGGRRLDGKSGDLIEGSMTSPVKFDEEWTWARPVGSDDWKLEGIKEV